MVDVLVWVMRRRVVLVDRAERLRKELAEIDAGASTQSVIWFSANPPGHTSIKVTGVTITPPGETHSVKLDWPGAPFANDADSGGTDNLYLEPVGYHA